MVTRIISGKKIILFFLILGFEKIPFLPVLINNPKIRLWHNNQGESPCWYLHRLVVEDMTTGESHNFVVQKWLGADKDIGTCDRIITKSPFFIETSFPFRYETKLMTLRRNNDLFFSMGSCTAPEIRELSLYERATLIALYFALLSLFHAMFYGQKNVRYEAQIDYFKFNYSDLLVAGQALAPTIVITCIIGMLFRTLKADRIETKELFLELPDIEDLKESRKIALVNLLQVSQGVPFPRNGFNSKKILKMKKIFNQKFN